MQARTGLFLAFALVLILLGMAAVEALMSMATGVFEMVPHN